MKRAIEDDFPITEINHLAVPERNAFKPIYQMHKWFARRASCVFRAIILSALKPTGTDIMAEFYKNHSQDPDTKGKIVLDPFMGGGTTIVEALRLGCKPVGIDLNPVSWFIVKTEVEPVALSDLDSAFERLSGHQVAWSGKPLRETLLSLYKTSGPWVWERTNDLPDSDIIYTFWIKSAICTSAHCRKLVQLFSDYVVAAKSPSIFYHADYVCSKCRKTFDWEIEPAALVADPRLMVHSLGYSGGVGRSNTRWTYAHPEGGLYVCPGSGGEGQASVKWGTLQKGQVCCPHCHEIVRATPMVENEKSKKKRKPQRKRVPLTVLLCPQTEEVFQWRGELPAAGTLVKSPAGHAFDPSEANVPAKGEFNCPHCGRGGVKVIESIRSLPEDRLLPMDAYGMQVYAPCCDPSNDPAKRDSAGVDLLGAEAFSQFTDEEEVEGAPVCTDYAGPYIPPTHNLIWKQRGKYYAAHAPADKAHFQEADNLWQKHRDTLPYPKSEVPDGLETSRLHEHHYHYWHHMFNPRQLLALSTLLTGISKEQHVGAQELLLSAFFSLLEGSNMFARFKKNQNKSESAKGIFARHDFQLKLNPTEDHIWGVDYGKGFVPWFNIVRAGKVWAKAPNDSSYDEAGKLVRISDGSSAEAKVQFSDDIIAEELTANIRCGDSRTLANAGKFKADLVITDPPYADNVNYAELADFFYVWLRLLLKARYSNFQPEYTPKLDEIVENKNRGVSADDFGEGLLAVFKRTHESLKDDGLLAFTFHHAEGSAWENLLSAVCDAGFEILAIYPIQSEGETSLHLQGNDAISYDLIHVCCKRKPEDVAKPRSWAGLRQEVRRRAREEVLRIETGRYGKEALPAPDVRMVLIGKCLEVYSRHYGAVIDGYYNQLPLRDAFKDIRMMVEQVVSKENPLPSQLEGADALSQVWLLALCDKKEVSVDSISKMTRGIFEVGDLTGHKPPLLRKGRVKGGRTYEVLSPSERLDKLREVLADGKEKAAELPLELPISLALEAPLVDVLHLLLAEAEAGERLDLLVDRFRGRKEAVQAALEFLQQRDPNRWGKACGKLLPFYSDMLAQQMTRGEN
jgi:16S rRNA G966 N2-methylase RsmD